MSQFINPDTGGDTTLIEHLLIEETGRISGDIYRRTIDTSPWLKLVKQNAWPNQMGDTLSVLTYERTLPPSETWSDINNATSDNNFCIPDAVQVPVAQTMQTYGLQHTAIESDPVCVHDVRMSYRFREQLRNIYDNLVENVGWMWKNRYRDQYADWAHHNVVAYESAVTTGKLIEAPGALANASGTAGVAGDNGSGMPTEDDATPFPVDFNVNNISKLTKGLLQKVYMALVRDGAGINPMGRENGRPVFTMITSAETSDHIIRQEGSTGTLSDFRYSSRVNELLAPLGVERSYNGFYHIIDPFPRRYTYTAGGSPGTSSWTEVLPYAADSSSYQGKQGSQNRYIVNSAYETAEYEDTFIFHTDVFESLIPAPLANAGSGVMFNPLTYRGDYKWLNIRDRYDNPDGSWGYYRGVLANAAKPVKPQWGYVIRHKRCDPVELFLDCTGTAIT